MNYGVLKDKLLTELYDFGVKSDDGSWEKIKTIAEMSRQAVELVDSVEDEAGLRSLLENKKGDYVADLLSSLLTKVEES